MTIAAGVVEAIKLGAELLPDVIEVIKVAIDLGQSGTQAQNIVRQNLKSLKARYEKAKREDMDALERKHGREPEFEDPSEDPEKIPSTLPPNPFDEG